MNSATYRVLRMSLGLTPEDVAKHLGVRPVSAQRWESSHQPPGIASEYVTGLYERYQQIIDEVLAGVDELEAGYGQAESVDLAVYGSAETARRVLGDDMTVRQHTALVGHILFALGDLDRARLFFVPEEET
ncbi:helix-turn-helix transcriptional regulator [Auritidibacter ignavus]|uniref:helix-turn-helix transcriptional regulator n=1 Tax=Auritidibacter TaxID=1160973 RepID=UPI000D7324BC|nr:MULTISPECIES: helix-turn-helix transcriptional regulator [Auritidibacter]PXA77947.1 hypothetical protein DCC24_03365 [Auritidibacter sp. NML100628]WGH91462.1 helix-turn-helix transcriptional regulator [Auritidibacter ignavus]